MMYDPPGSSLFALRLAGGLLMVALFQGYLGNYWVAVPSGLAGIYCFWKSIGSKGTDY